MENANQHCYLQKMDITTGAQQELGYPAARLNEKGCLPVWGWRCSNKRAFETPAVLGTAKSIKKQPNLAIRILSLLIKKSDRSQEKEKMGG
jgi:hypothetical protein